MVALCVVLDHLHGLQFLQAGLLCNLVLTFIGIMLQMSYVRDIANIAHLVSKFLQEAEQDVVGNTRASVTKMRVSVNGGTAHVHAHMTFMDGLEEFLGAGKRICKV